MLKKFLGFLTASKPEPTAQNDVVNQEFMGTEGVWKDDKFYFNRRKEGCVNGKHFTEYVGTVKELKRTGRLDEAEALLLSLVEATEAESRKGVGGVAPWYYEQLAIIYRKQNNIAKEVSILRRYESQEKAHGAKPSILS
jgi:hypothetical protein